MALQKWLPIFFCLSAFSAMAGDCAQVSRVCVDTTPAKNISGVMVALSAVGGCWDTQVTYQCRSHQLVSDCELLRKRGCVQIGSSCIADTPSGACSLYEQKYHCPEYAESYSERTICAEKTFCLDGTGCFDTHADPDKDFAIAAVMMEAAREAGVYGIDPDKIEIFKGYSEQCSIKILSGQQIKSCCGASNGGSALSNYHVLGAAALTNAASAVGKEVVKTGSKYVFDALYANVDNTLLKQGLAALGAGTTEFATATTTEVAATATTAAVNTATEAATSTAIAGTTFGAYGFEFSYSLANGLSFVGFDPSTLALQIGVMVMQKWLACDATEQNLSMKKGLNLCAHINSYCHKKILGVCVEKKERHCCFNSKLAKVINRQGRAQLGLSMDACSGFTQEQLQTIDFDQIDFTEFMADILPKEVDPQAMMNNANTKVKHFPNQYQDSVKGYYD